jgi:hypothetical protein
MQLELIRNEANRVVGYKLLKQETDNTHEFEYVRDMIFYGWGDDALTYDGRTTDKETDHTIELRWVTKSHAKVKRELMEKEFEELVKNKNLEL